MSEKRYSMGVCGEYAKINQATIWARARRLGMETKNGLTASELKAVIQMGHRKGGRSSLEDLKFEMEALR